MRYNAEHKAATHKRIVAKAAEEFRLHGLEGVGIAPLMGALGLTHGGFYAHFDDKDALVEEAAALGMEQSLARIKAAMEAAPPGGRIQAVLDLYLSPGHRDHPEVGCPAPALGAELARRPEPVRRRFGQVLEEVIDQLATAIPGETRQQRRTRATALFSGLVGAVLLSRSVSDGRLSEAILRSARVFGESE